MLREGPYRPLLLDLSRGSSGAMTISPRGQVSSKGDGNAVYKQGLF